MPDHIINTAAYQTLLTQGFDFICMRAQGNALIDEVGGNGLACTGTMTVGTPNVAGHNATLGSTGQTTANQGFASDSAVIPIGSTDPFRMLVVFKPDASEVHDRVSGGNLGGVIFDAQTASGFVLGFVSATGFDWLYWGSAVGGGGTNAFRLQYTGDDLLEAGDTIVLAVSVNADGSGFAKRYGDSSATTFSAGAFTGDFRDALVQVFGRVNNSASSGLIAEFGPIAAGPTAFTDEAEADAAMEAVVLGSGAVVTSSSSSSGSSTMQNLSASITTDVTEPGSTLPITLSSGYGNIGTHLVGYRLAVTSGDCRYVGDITGVISGHGTTGGVVRLSRPLGKNAADDLPSQDDLVLLTAPAVSGPQDIRTMGA